MSPPRALIFDKDGTLFDFNATWGAVMARLIAGEAQGDARLSQRLAQVLGFDPETELFLPGSIVIAETGGVVARAIADVTGDAEPQVRARMEAEGAQAVQVPSCDLAPLMRDLRARGLTLGVVTNDDEASAQAHLSEHALTEHLAFVAGYNSGFGAKPAPGQLLAFCQATGIGPEHCVMIGDSLHDLHAGRAAGMRTIGVLTGPAEHDELAPSADVVLSHIGEIPDWLDQTA